MLHVIDITGNSIILEIAGIHSDWTMYKFEIDVETPGKKVSIVSICMQKNLTHQLY